MTPKGKRKSATVCVAAAVILAWFLVPATDCLRLKKTERRGGRKEADATKISVKGGEIVFGRVFEKGSGLGSLVTDGIKRSNASVEEEVTYQADSAGWTKGQTQDAGSKEASWKRLSSSLQCGGDQLKFRAVGLGASQFALDQGNASPMPLSQIPSTCGYSMHRNSFALVMLVPYDGCNMVQQGENYVLPMRWQGIPVSLWCPKAVVDTPTAPAAGDPAKQPEGPKFPQFPFYPPRFPYFHPSLPITTAAPTTATAAPTKTAAPVTATAAPTTTKLIVPAKRPEEPPFPQFPFYYPPMFPYFQPPLPVTTAEPTTTTTAEPTTTTTAAPTTTTTAPPTTTTSAPTSTKPAAPAKKPVEPHFPQFPFYYPPMFPYFQPPLPVTTAPPTTTATAPPTTTATAAPTTTATAAPTTTATAAPTTTATAAPTSTKPAAPAKKPEEPHFPQFPFYYPRMFPYFHPPLPVTAAAPVTTTTPPPTTTTVKPAASAPPSRFPLPLPPYIPQLPWSFPGSMPPFSKIFAEPPSPEFPPYMPVFANYPPYVLPPPFPPYGFSHYQYPTPKPETTMQTNAPTTTPTTTTTAAAEKTTVQRLVYPSSHDAFPFLPYGHPFGPYPF